MSTYVIGDVQGCFATLQHLLQTMNVRPDVDRVWLLGDLVGRGPDALGVLRFVAAQRSYISAVLGNHDLALLAFAERLAQPQPSDKLDAVLAAPDAESLLQHLRSAPFAHLEGDAVLLHAGVLPGWDQAEILARAQQVSTALQSSAAPSLLARFLRLPGVASAGASERVLDESLRVLTCVRTLDADGVPFAAYKGELAHMPNELTPWFRWPQPAWAPARICAGHWSALGLYQEGRVTTLDGGCVWGRTLCGMRLEDGALYEVQSVEANA